MNGALRTSLVFCLRNFRSREDGLNLVANGSGDSVTAAELEKVKQEILTEMRMEMSKMKDDIIQGAYEKF